MSTPDAAILALEKAIKFESDGRDFYIRAADTAKNPLAKKIFTTLAADEADHIKRVREIFEELKDKPGWPPASAMIARQAGILDVFEAAAYETDFDEDVDAKKALATAIEMERRGLAFYTERMQKASCDAESNFYEKLVAEEKAHAKALEATLNRLESA